MLCEGDFDERMFLERELSGEIVATHKMRDMDRLVSCSHVLMVSVDLALIQFLVIAR